MTRLSSALRAALPAAAMALTLGAAVPAQAGIVFTLSWLANPAADGTIVSSPDATLSAFGTVEIDAAAGESFTLADIVSTNVTVTGAAFASFAFTSWSSAAGSIAADGLSATFVGSGSAEPFSLTAPGFFGCRLDMCSDGIIRVRSDTDAREVLYSSADAALASIRLTVAASPVSTTGTMPLVALALAGLALARKKR